MLASPIVMRPAPISKVGGQSSVIVSQNSDESHNFIPIKLTRKPHHLKSKLKTQEKTSPANKSHLLSKVQLSPKSSAEHGSLSSIVIDSVNDLSGWGESETMALKTKTFDTMNQSFNYLSEPPVWSLKTDLDSQAKEVTEVKTEINTTSCDLTAQIPKARKKPTVILKKRPELSQIYNDKFKVLKNTTRSSSSSLIQDILHIYEPIDSGIHQSQRKMQIDRMLKYLKKSDPRGDSHSLDTLPQRCYPQQFQVPDNQGKVSIIQPKVPLLSYSNRRFTNLFSNADSILPFSKVVKRISIAPSPQQERHVFNLSKTIEQQLPYIGLSKRWSSSDANYFTEREENAYSNNLFLQREQASLRSLTRENQVPPDENPSKDACSGPYANMKILAQKIDIKTLQQ